MNSILIYQSTRIAEEKRQIIINFFVVEKLMNGFIKVINYYYFFFFVKQQDNFDVSRPNLSAMNFLQQFMGPCHAIASSPDYSLTFQSSERSRSASAYKLKCIKSINNVIVGVRNYICICH